MSQAKKPSPRGFGGPTQDDLIALVKSLAEAKLKESGITPQVAGAMGIMPMTRMTTARNSIWGRQYLSALELQYFEPRTGERVMDNGEPFSRYRALEYPTPMPKDFPKYMQLRGTGVHAYFPRWEPIKWGMICDDPTQPLIITEGELKAACACFLGFPTIGLGGVWMFTSKDGAGGRKFLEELTSIVWPGRRVTIIFDYDPKVAVNKDVERARQALANELLMRGAKVFFGNLKGTMS